MFNIYMSRPWASCNTDGFIDRVYYYGGSSLFLVGILASFSAVVFLILSVMDYDIPTLSESSNIYFLKAVFFAVVCWSLYNLLPFC